MSQYGFRQLPTDGIQGIQTGQGILEYHTDFFAADAPHFVGRQIVDPVSGQMHRAASDVTGWLNESGNSRTKLYRQLGPQWR